MARDPFGVEAVATVQVIGLVDYRAWPWALVAGLLIAGAGVALYLRTPQQRSVPEISDGDGRLEEIEGDPD